MGVQVEVRLPWMRSLPWRCIDRLTVAFDGRDVPGTDLRVRIGDRVVDVDDVRSLDGYWVVGTPIVLIVSYEPAPEVERIGVRVTVTSVIPYVAGRDGPVAITAVGEEHLVPRGGASPAAVDVA